MQAPTDQSKPRLPIQSQSQSRPNSLLRGLGLSATGCADMDDGVEDSPNAPDTTKLLHKRPTNTTISSTNTTISSVDPWSSPLDMESTMTQVDNAADADYDDMGLIEDEFAECDEVHRLGDQANIPRLSPAGSNFEMISSMNTPISPRTLASPCGSSDFEMIPQSPSISWLYDGAPSDTLSQHHLSLLINPRTTSMIKSVSSPGCLITSGPSLFSPPPVHFHQKFFESRRMNMSPFRSSSDPPAAAKDSGLHA
ncbi:hypothetical protein LPJ66_007311 [Kickxella alabastrina]|uniref:Uncharacterized protein n=1 Tax=Kickxella alabastrina TaxID=61397 RepID=A0ACC1IFB7_9FUNG|nr:hypothetical protein LPJ66_007311 [Kickxella alabastrina]